MFHPVLIKSHSLNIYIIHEQKFEQKTSLLHGIVGKFYDDRCMHESYFLITLDMV